MNSLKRVMFVDTLNKLKLSLQLHNQNISIFYFDDMSVRMLLQCKTFLASVQSSINLKRLTLIICVFLLFEITVIHL